MQIGASASLLALSMRWATGHGLQDVLLQCTVLQAVVDLNVVVVLDSWGVDRRANEQRC